MRPEEVVYGLEDGEGPVPGLEGFEAAEDADPASEGAVEALQEVVAHGDWPRWLTGVPLNWATTCLAPGTASAIAGG